MFYITRLAFFLCLAAPFGLFAEHDWPQWRGPERDGGWRETGLRTELEMDAEGWIQLKWSAEVAAGYSQPTVADGRVYVSDRLDDPDEIERVHCFVFPTVGKRGFLRVSTLRMVGQRPPGVPRWLSSIFN